MDKRKRAVLLGIMSCVASVFAQVDLPWKQEYKGADATGADVIALWQFNKGAELEDSSGKGHKLTLGKNGRLEEQGRFGGGLRSLPHGGNQSINAGAYCADKDDLSPKGAFSVELWLKPDPEFFNQYLTYLVDKKNYHYAKDIEAANWDYSFYCTKEGKEPGVCRLNVSLGFKTHSAWIASPKVTLEPGVWTHLAFTYNGAGFVRIFKDGEVVCRREFDGGPVEPGSHKLTIGERSGSNYFSCPGVIDMVRICNGIVPFYTGKVKVSATNSRTAFYRFEKDRTLTVTFHNDAQDDIIGAKIKVSVGGTEKIMDIGNISALNSSTVSIPVNTALRPGTYTVDVIVDYTANGKSHGVNEKLEYTIVPRDLPFMPVILWGMGDIPRLKDIGFTHNMRYMSGLSEIWKAGKPTDMSETPYGEQVRQSINEHLKNGLRLCLSIAPGMWIARNLKEPKYNRTGKDGQPLGVLNADVAHPDIQQYGFNTGATLTKTYGDFPNWDLTLIHSEVRDSTAVSWQPWNIESAEKFLGGKIPDRVEGKGGVPYSTISDFPISRIIPDNDPLLRFYTWFWKDGDGWNPLHSSVHNGLKSEHSATNRWTFFDPAVRVPPIWGSGGNVDYVSQWTYSYPDPIKVGQACDELFTMAEGCPDQQVMKMTQVIWYRSRTAPNLPEDESKRVEWEKRIPDAKFISISPHHLSEALWSELARPVRGVMYHGWASLVDVDTSHGSYRFTNPDTAPMLKKLIAGVVRPLGPSFLQIPDKKADVAILESFASSVFAGRGPRGWSNGWIADMHLVLQWAGLQPSILFEETINKKGLDGIKILVMPHCDVLPESVAKKVLDFQKRGGIVVADEFLCPAIMPDILIPQYNRGTKPGDPKNDKAALQQISADLSRQIEPFYKRSVWSDNSDLVLRTRSFGNYDYLFTINDKRTFGNYVGQHGLVMEEGLPNDATITIARKGYVYDLVNHTRVRTVNAGDKMLFKAQYGPGEGRVFLISPVKLDDIDVDVKDKVDRGDKVRISIDAEGFKGVLPLEVRIYDTEGREAEFSGYYAAVKGKLTIDLNIAVNDVPGKWKIVVRDLASGEVETESFRVR